MDSAATLARVEAERRLRGARSMTPMVERMAAHLPDSPQDYADRVSRAFGRQP